MADEKDIDKFVIGPGAVERHFPRRVNIGHVKIRDYSPVSKEEKPGPYTTSGDYPDYLQLERKGNGSNSTAVFKFHSTDNRPNGAWMDSGNTQRMFSLMEFDFDSMCGCLSLIGQSKQAINQSIGNNSSWRIEDLRIFRRTIGEKIQLFELIEWTDNQIDYMTAYSWPEK